MIEINEAKNPANAPEKKKDTKRIPMSVPHLKLTVPDIPGYHCHWMRGSADRLQQARQAGYTFVEDDEIGITNFDLAGDAEDTGNTDLGSLVSIASGTDDKGNAVRLYLMKLPLELWEQDQKSIGDRNEATASALRGDTLGEAQYIPKDHKKAVASIYQRKS